MPYPPRHNVLITGLPRSGTTLVNAIVDGLPNALSLSEPGRHGSMFEESFSARDLVRRIRDDLPNLRQEIIDGLPLEDRRNPDGSAVTNYFAASQAGAPRPEIFSQLKVTRAGLRPDFLLGIKHNALFTGVLPHLLEVDDWSVVCVIRNPIDVVCSWRSLDLPVSHGRLPLGERYWLELREISASERDLLEKQILLCELFYRRYREAGPRVTVLRYEDLVADLRSFLAAIGREEAQPPDLVRPPAAPSAAAAGRAGVSSVARKLGAAGALPNTAHFYGNDLAGES
jgi:hypothetical protein